MIFITILFNNYKLCLYTSKHFREGIKDIITHHLYDIIDIKFDLSLHNMKLIGNCID